MIHLVKNVPNKTFKRFICKCSNKITRFNESKRSAKHISCDSKCKVDGRKYNSDQRWKIDICQGEYKELMKHCVCKED